MRVARVRGRPFLQGMFKGPTNIWPKGADGPLSILSGQTVVLPCGSTKDYSSITIEAGGTLEVGPGNGWTIIGCSGNCTINGKVIARGGFGAAQTVGGVEVRRSTYTAEAPDKTQLSYSVYHSRGGARAVYAGYIAGSSAGGMGGDGGGGGGASGVLSDVGEAHLPVPAGTDINPAGRNGVSASYDGGATVFCSGGSAGATNGVGVLASTTTLNPNYSARGGNAGKAGGGGGGQAVYQPGRNGGDSDDIAMKAGNGAAGSAAELVPSPGAGGGGGRHGQGIYLRVAGGLSGSGLINASGSHGGDGGVGVIGYGDPGGKFAYDATPGGSGGGGGSGGKIKIIASSKSDLLVLLADRGLGGSGGVGGQDGSFYTYAPSGNAGENGEAGTVEVN